MVWPSEWQFVCNKDAIWNSNHLTIQHVLTIGIPNVFDIQIPTVILNKNDRNLPSGQQPIDSLLHFPSERRRFSRNCDECKAPPRNLKRPFINNVTQIQSKFTPSTPTPQSKNVHFTAFTNYFLLAVHRTVILLSIHPAPPPKLNFNFQKSFKMVHATPVLNIL